jgi:predicted nuclease with TOPRIM domain
MTEQELYNEYRKSDCKSFTDFLINKITELKKTYRKQRNKRIDELQKENKELKKQLEMSNKVYNDNLDYSHHIEGQLNKAKEIIEKVAKMYRYSPRVEEIIEQAEQFLSEVEKC